ncbi:50S ribosomal protein L10 [Oceanidesulfovibrio indonesiensis]|uniref:Large ribosomal subunit protein uL10 n=1 Tax=Oceanidesulfovibrio indonesiensis TaxID=54767 RepID=A0A7M3MHF6_9BACT|nr:50S ribosomal protein L10 [Oceanidesulfovibrio indonesiensis]TVM18927.1 50S ribosomal protein L10 [Oceanidesulfovibrio indonesiensis]
MNRAEKAEVIEAIKAKADEARIAIVTDFKGLKVEETTALRVKLREAGVDYQVVKNTLARIAFTGGTHEVLSDKLKETCAVAFGYEDPVAAAKVLTEFSKGNKKFSIRFASLMGSYIEEKGVEDLSKLPGRQELLAKLLGTMNAVPQNFVGLLANVPRSFLNVLTAIKDEKEQAA